MSITAQRTGASESGLPAVYAACCGVFLWFPGAELPSRRVARCFLPSQADTMNYFTRARRQGL